MTPGLVVAMWALATATFFTVGMLAFAVLDPLVANSVAQVVALAGIPVLYARSRGDGLTGLGLGRVEPRAVLGAVLMGACVWYVGLRIATPIVEAMQREEEIEALTRVILGDDAPLLGILVASAIVPALCEELLHRGLLLPGLVAWLGRVGGVIAGAALFAIIHIEPARIASTFVIGVLAGVLAVRTRSLWPVIALHLVNNTSALLVATSDGDPLTRAIAAHPDVALTVAIAGVLAGLAVATWASPARSRQS